MQHISEIEKIQSCYANNLRDPVNRQLTPKTKKIFLVNFVAIRSRKSSSRVLKKTSVHPDFFRLESVRLIFRSGSDLTNVISPQVVADVAVIVVNIVDVVVDFAVIVDDVEMCIDFFFCRPDY